MGQRLMVVAHPDDEAIFGGANLLYKVNWKVICVTNGSNTQRAAEFRTAMNIVGARHEIWDYRDSYEGNFDEASLEKRLAKVIRQNHFDQVVTHNYEGEYGHRQHVAISRILHDIVKSNLYVFSIADRRLKERVLLRKQELLRVYRSQSHTISDLALEDYIERENFVRVK